MKQQRLRTRAALMLSAAALLSTPVLAQVAAPADQAAPAPQAATPAPPPVAPPPAAPVAVTPPAAAETPAAQSAPTGASTTPVNPEAAAQAAAEDAAARREARPARRARPAARPPAPRAAAPAAAEPATQAAPEPTPTTPSVDPTAVTQVETPAATTEQPQADPSAAAPATDTATERAPEPGPPMWPLALIALLIVVGGVWFLMSRRRKAEAEDAWTTPPLAAEPAVRDYPVIERPVMQETARPAPIAPAAAAAAAGVMVDKRVNMPAAVAADVSDVAPVVPEDTSVETPHEEDIAALTAAAPVGDRPWLEFAMRPVRAGTSADEALVEIELTVANAGNMVAEDVRISTFMLPAGNDGDLDQMLVKGDDTVTPQTIAAGEGTRVDATLAMTRASLPEGGTFQPVVVADARYRLPNGSEGRTSAAFLVGGLAEDGTTIQPMDLEARLIREDVSAQLYRDPVRI